MSWLLLIAFILLGIVSGLWQWREKDLTKRRDRFGRMILKTDDQLRPEGWKFKHWHVEDGIFYGHGKAIWERDGAEMSVEHDRL